MGLISDAVDEVVDELPAIRVHIVGSDVQKEEGTEYWSANTFIVLGTSTEQGVQILAQDLRRKRAVVNINPGFADNNTAGFIVLGSQGGMSTRQGALYTSGNQIIFEHGRAVWLIGDGFGHAFTVSVSDERYAAS